jgi:hypothetical protein
MQKMYEIIFENIFLEVKSKTQTYLAKLC